MRELAIKILEQFKDAWDMYSKDVKEEYIKDLVNLMCEEGVHIMGLKNRGEMLK